MFLKGLLGPDRPVCGVVGVPACSGPSHTARSTVGRPLGCGRRRPSTAQQTVPGYYVRPDFAYRTGGSDFAVFIDGPVHDTDHQKTKDNSADGKLIDEAGWLVLRFHHEDARTAACGEQPGWASLIARYPSVFGPGTDPP